MTNIRLMLNSHGVCDRQISLIQGLGKTVQVLSLLCALFKKTGTAMDLLELDRRKKLIQDRMETFRLQQERALVQGDIIDVPEALSTCDQDELNLSKEWFPVVIIVPKTVLQNWRNEFATWSHFGLAVYNSGGERETALERIRCGSCEVLLTTHPCFQQSDVFKQLNSISWKLVIIDEFHKFKVVWQHSCISCQMAGPTHLINFFLQIRIQKG